MNNCSHARTCTTRGHNSDKLRICSQPGQISHFPEDTLCFALCVLFWPETFAECFQGHAQTKIPWGSQALYRPCHQKVMLASLSGAALGLPVLTAEAGPLAERRSPSKL